MVGLKILFQQQDSATVRGFIINLVIFAILVNFSLVIAQGIVAIADTVQSQFLPENTKVIEALGQKLMVEPVKQFQAATGNAPGTTYDSDKFTLGDTVKPLVLLVLAVAAFFSFVAIAAFLAVRLVALMVLYMVSPIAYVGMVMPETRSYAMQWWTNFMKYAFLTPILVFFLNIAALVATTFASQAGGVINTGDSIASSIVDNSLTIISHFITLLFIYAGMQVALSSGTYGSKKIVDLAQKGFSGIPKLANRLKQSAASSTAQALRNRGYDKSANALMTATNPLAFYSVH